MMWKCLVAFLLIGVVAGRVHIPLSRRERLREGIEEECVKYGNADKIDEVEQGALNFIDCIVEQIDVQAYRSLGLVDNEDDLPDALINFVKATCTKKSEINKCFNDFVDSSAPCMEPESKENIEVSKRTLEKMSGFVCDNDAQKFTEVINDGALTCFDAQAVPLIRCLRNFETMGNYKTISVAEACTQVTTLSGCVVSSLAKCPKPTTSEFVSRLFDDLYKGSRCPGPVKDVSVAPVTNNSIDDDYQLP